MTTYPVTVTEGLTFSDLSSNGRIFLRLVRDGLVVRSQSNARALPGAIVSEHVRVSLEYLANGSFGLTLSERINVRTTLINVLAVQLVQRLNLSAATSIALATRIAERAQISALPMPQGIAQQVAAERLILSASTIPFLSFLIEESLVMHDQASWLYAALATIEEGLQLTSAFVPTLVAMVVEHESLELTDDAANLRMVYQMMVDECLWLGQLAEPAGGVTTWAMNARSGAVSFYDNWSEFNSFAGFGDRYLAASMDGLYELVGDMDQVTPIVARIGKRDVEMTGSYLTGLKAAYVAIRGDGQMFLRIDGDRKSTVYSVTPSRMRTARVDLGKGWRSRYLSWELTTVGQDFDLDGLEFLPIQFGRRVGR